MQKVETLQEQGTDQRQLALNLQREFLKLKKEEVAAQAKILEYQKQIDELAAKMKEQGIRLADTTTTEGKKRASLFSQKTGANKELRAVQASIQELENSLNSLGFGVLDSISEVEGLDSAFLEFIGTLGAAKGATQLSTGAIIANTIATKANTLAKSINTMTEGLRALPGLIGKLFKLIGTGIAALGKGSLALIKLLLAKIAGTTAAAGASTAGTAAAGATAAGATAAAAGATSLGAALGSLAAAIASFLTILAGVIAAVATIGIVFEGLWRWLANGEDVVESFFHGTLATTIADGLYNLVANWNGAVDEMVEKSKKLDEEIKKGNQDRATLRDLKDDLAKIRMEEALKSLLPAELISELEKRGKKVEAEAKKYEWMIANMGTARSQGMYSLGEGETVASKRVEFQRKLNELTREQYQLAGQLNSATEAFKKEMSELQDLEDQMIDTKWDRILQQSSPAKQYQLLSEDLRGIDEEMADRIKRINELKRLMDEFPSQRANYTKELIAEQKALAELTREQYATQDKISAITEKVKSQLEEIANVEKQLEKLNFDRSLANLLPDQAIIHFKSMLRETENSIIAAGREIYNLKIAMKVHPENNADNAEKLLAQQKRLLELTREKYAIEDKLIQQQEKLNKQNVELKNQWKQIAEIENELMEIRLDRFFKDALPEQSIKRLNRLLFENQTAINGVNYDLSNLKRELSWAPWKAAELNPQILAKQKKYLELMKEKFSLEDQLAEQQKKTIELNKTFGKQLTEVSKNYQTVSESFAWGYNKQGVFENRSEEVKLSNLRKNIRGLVQELGKSSRNLDDLKEREVLLKGYFALVKEEGDIKLATMEKEREAAKTNLQGMVEIVRQAREFRETAQQSIEANSTEALRLQSRRPDEINKNALDPIIEQQKSIKNIEERMLSSQTRTTSLLNLINSSMARLIKQIGRSSGASAVNLEPVI